MSHNDEFLIVGAGIYGCTAALELQRRGYRVALIDPGPIPHPLASSTDVSKAVRILYGTDTDYMQIVDEAIDGWHAWNAQFDDTLYHEVGMTMVTRQPMQPGDFEYESYQAALKMGHTPERLDAAELTQRFPAWRAGAYADGYFFARGGFAESGRVVGTLAQHARALGIAMHEGQTVAELVRDGQRIAGVTTRTGQTFYAEHTILCTGVWTPYLLPELQSVMKITGHPVFHLKPADPALFTPPHFTVFAADTSRTGWYGFPLHPREGIVKIANHGVGVTLHPEHGERVVTAEDTANLRQMLADTFPALVEAPIVYTRRCLYCDTLDAHLWIDRHPTLAGLTVAAGGSGHAFKMAPLLGQWIADAAEGQANRWLPKFRWRELSPDMVGQEASRYQG